MKSKKLLSLAEKQAKDSLKNIEKAKKLAKAEARMAFLEKKQAGERISGKYVRFLRYKQSIKNNSYRDN